MARSARTSRRAGFKVAHSDLPTGVIRPDGSHVLFSRDRARNVATFEACAKGDGAAFAREMDRMGADAPFLFALLGGRLWSRQTATLLAREAWKRGPRALAAWFGEALQARAALSRIDLRLGRDSRALGALGPALRPQSRERLFGADDQGHRLRHRNGGLPDRGRRREDPGRRLRAAHRRQWRADPVRRGCRPHRDGGRGRARAGRAAGVGGADRSLCRESSAR